MTQEEYRSAMDEVIYLCASMVNGEEPDKERVASMDLERLYKAADRHLLTGIVGYALEAAGIYESVFVQAKAKAIRKVVLFDTERAKVLQALDEAGIWYMPMKGSVLKDLYPKIGMRQMADNDILYDASRSDDVRTIMEGLGFTTEEFGISHHDHYNKEPVCNFEMHRIMFTDVTDVVFFRYYDNIKERLIKDPENACGYHFKAEDFYIYMIAHEYKHFSNSGTGLRSLLDTYVYLDQKGGELDLTYIERETQKLGIAEFEKNNRALATRLFSGTPLTEQDEDMLGYVLSSGTYGTMTNYVRNQITKKGRLGYLLSRTFPPYRSMKTLYPILESLPFLLPICWVLRLVKALITKPSKVMYQFTAAFK